MGKVKLLYDVIMTMKEKESVKGNLKVEGSKDQVKIFNLNNTFEKNMTEGWIKAKISLETDCAGKKVKHESNTEFDLTGFPGCQRHGLMHRGVFHHWHDRHSHHGYQDGMKCGGIKGKLNKLAIMVSMLNSMKIEAQEDKSTLISLDFNDIPGDMKTILQEKLQQHRMHHNHCSHGAFKEFSGMEIGNTRLTIRVNKNNEVEKVLLNAEGQAKDESGAPHPLNLQVELSLTW
ncbi:hypothetical protein SAMN05660649_01965 [Desulfotomaculum arcticum]|uniref:Uncharacterized protein n=1 Tax=Desulfotruncus arcticus DSM 17038 TaxID=1121424 RepID=A0A1I2STZ5_9FIRM|nr:hypothetical protein [Desulfotruncus arcticus]SFG55349.1 hypothetical protein SAMN05660649_01965 [Desulfotomaculum arcticum] [Desulfotruncus arcticus DSM 17038]